MQASEPDFNTMLPMLGLMLVVVAAIYVYMAVVFQMLARKTGTPDGWMAWIPIANLVLLCRIAGKSPAFVLLLMIPVVNLIVAVILWMGVARARGKSEALGYLMLIPIVNLIVPWYLASGPAAVPVGAFGYAAPPPPQWPPQPQQPYGQAQYPPPPYQQQPPQQPQAPPQMTYAPAPPPVCPACGRPECVGGDFCGYTGQPIRNVPYMAQQQPPQQQPLQPGGYPPQPHQPMPPYPPQPVQAARGGGGGSSAKWVVAAVLFAVLIGGAGYWYFAGSSPGTARPIKGQLPARMAGTLKEFPVATSANPAKSTSVVVRGPGGNGKLPPGALPAGIPESRLPQIGPTSVTATYQTSPKSPSVAVTVIDTGGGQGPLSGTLGTAVAQGAGPGATTTGIEISSQAGATYSGVVVRSPGSTTYILDKTGAPVVIIIYAAVPQAAPLAEALAKNVGNGQGLLEDPEAAFSLGALPDIPPGIQLVETETYTGDGLMSSLAEIRSAAGNDFGPEAAQVFEQIRVLIPLRLLVARYRDASRRELNLVVGDYGNAFKGVTTWLIFRTFMGMAGMQSVQIEGGDALTVVSEGLQYVVFRKGSMIGLVSAPPGNEALMLARGVSPSVAM